MSWRNFDAYATTCPKCGHTVRYVEAQRYIECQKCFTRINQEKEMVKSVLSELTSKIEQIRSSKRGKLMSELYQTNQNDLPPSRLDKVNGLSSFQCKLVAQYATYYKVQNNQPVKLPAPFECFKTSTRAFLINKEDLAKPFYGRDQTGSSGHLNGLLSLINANGEGLVPLHVDGDGHCLVHALSRAICGREVFWHALRVNLHAHLQKHRDSYLSILATYFDKEAWDRIVEEALPTYLPSGEEQLGLLPVHVFGLANALRRPIILFDCLEKGKGEHFGGVFLPVLHSVEECTDKAKKTLHAPLIIAWSSNSHNHYVPLVSVKGGPRACLPRALLPPVWGVDEVSLDLYLHFDDNGLVELSSQEFTNEFIPSLVGALEEVFLTEHGFAPSLVQSFVCDIMGEVDVLPLDQLVSMVESKHKAGSLRRCTSCGVLSIHSPPRVEDLERGGRIYNKVYTKAISGLVSLSDVISIEGRKYKYSYEQYGDRLVEVEGNKESTGTEGGASVVDHRFQDGGELAKISPRDHEFRFERKIYMYNKETRQFEILENEICSACSLGELRKVKPDGSPEYYHGDKTLIPSTTSKCCGKKHYLNINGLGYKFYDSIPTRRVFTFVHHSKQHPVEFYWVDDEPDQSLLSNPLQVAQYLVATHFPGDFNGQVLERQFTDAMLHESDTKHQKAIHTSNPENGNNQSMSSSDQSFMFGQNSPYHSSVGVTSISNRVISKNDLGLSKTEVEVAKRVQENAPKMQARLTNEEKRKKEEEVAKKAAQQSPIKTLQTPIPMTDQEERSLPDIARNLEEEECVPMVVEKSPQPTPLTTPPRSEKKKSVRVNFDGKNLKLELDASGDLTYGELLAHLEALTSVPSSSIKVSHGHPPKDLHRDPLATVPLAHGDKLLVEDSRVSLDALPPPSPRSSPLHSHRPSTSSSSTSLFSQRPSQTSLSDRSHSQVHTLSNSSSRPTLFDSLPSSNPSSHLNNNALLHLMSTFVSPENLKHGGLIYMAIQHENPTLVSGQVYKVGDFSYRYDSYNDKFELA